jgi:alpha-galactosidase
MRYFGSFIFLFFAAATTLLAQQTTIPIVTDENAVVLQTDAEGRLNVIYSGRRLQNASEYATTGTQFDMHDENAGLSNNVYTPAGTWNLFEPAIQLTHADGNNSLELKYISHDTEKIDDNVSVTSILLRDPVYQFEVTLFFKIYSHENVIEQWSVLRNTEKKPVTLKKYASANLYFFDTRYFLTQYHGAWAKEMQPEESEITAGIKTLDSKLGTRANLFQPPSFSVAFGGPAEEEHGTVMLGTLAWSGNFKIDLERDTYNHLRVIAGINPFASEYQLMPSKTFQTPSFIYTISHNGKGAASRNLTRWARKYRLLDGNGSRMTLLNNWESTYFDFDENKLVGLFKGAKDLGVDMFLLDDGWFGNKYPRNDDHAGLGDWQENVKKLPHGIGYLVKQATEAGIKFGIWVEPEMVNPKSELYEKHPDWVIRQPNRPEHYFRNQLVLDLANPEVQNFVFRTIDSLFIKNPGLAFIKWDCNAVIFDAHSNYLQKKKLPQGQLYVDYVKGLYSVLQRVREKYPAVPMMLCSGGGGRVDYEALKYFTEYWPSDNTDPLERVFIQWEDSYFFPSIASCNHVTEWSKVPLKFRIDVAMMGKLGFDIDVSKLGEKDLAFAKQAIKDYKYLSDVIWHGDLYRLRSPWKTDVASVMYVNENASRAVIMNYLVGNRYNIKGNAEPVLLKGLGGNKKYRIREMNVYPGAKPLAEEIYSGDYLMKVGFNPKISRSRTSVILSVEEVK